MAADDLRRHGERWRSSRAPAAGRLRVRIVGALVLVITAAGCSRVVNSPYETGAEASNTFFTAFQERSPKYMDPTASYAVDETPYTYSVYEPLLRFHYLKRPYTLAPRTAAALPAVRYLDKDGRELSADVPGEQVAESVYEIQLQPGIRFAPHPAFARDAAGRYLYHGLAPADTAGKRTPFDFPQTGTRELTAHDYVYAIRRLATTRIKSPSFSLMSEYIVGLKEYGEQIAAIDRDLRKGLPPTQRDLPFLDFRRWEMPGAVALDDHRLRIRIKGKYPQFKYWLTMTFFAPVPWEADAFYANPGFAAADLSLNRWPVGTGPFMLTEYQENRRHVLTRNPNFRGEPYPCDGEPADRAAGLLADCGKPMPFVDRVVFSVEKERIPHKTKFQQGWYDEPEVYRFDWLLDFNYDVRNSASLQTLFAERGIRMPATFEISNWYLGFNWLDPVVGGGKTPQEAERNRKLRQAISIAIDWEEFTKVFEYKADGKAAMGPLPPGVFGHRPELVNRSVYDIVDGVPKRKSIEEARRLLAEAGYPDGRDAASGRPLVLNYDYQRQLTPELKAEVDWMVKQFAKLGVQLEVRATDYNRFQEKAEKGSLQIYWWGWFADYPDAENFLFLLYGPNSKALTNGNGENASNYRNDEFDRLFQQMKYMDDGPQKQQTIDRMMAIVQQDAPWSWGYNPYAGSVHHQWVSNLKPGPMVMDRLLYYKVDPALRAAKVAEWNKPVWWPLWIFVALLALSVWPVLRLWKRRERETAGRDQATAAAGRAQASAE